MIPKILHQFLAGEPSDDISRWMATVRKFNPDWKIVVWNPDDIIGLRLNCEDLKFWCKNWAGVSNIVRLHALNEFGGVWIDTDCEMLKPLDPLLEHDAFCALQDTNRICNAVVGAIPEHPFIRWQIARQEMLKCEDAAVGVTLISEAPRADVTILATEFFYPWSYSAPPGTRFAHQNSYCIHHWKGSWQKKSA